MAEELKTQKPSNPSSIKVISLGIELWTMLPRPRVLLAKKEKQHWRLQLKMISMIMPWSCDILCTFYVQLLLFVFNAVQLHIYILYYIYTIIYRYFEIVCIWLLFICIKHSIMCITTPKRRRTIERFFQDVIYRCCFCPQFQGFQLVYRLGGC